MREKLNLKCITLPELRVGDLVYTKKGALLMTVSDIRLIGADRIPLVVGKGTKSVRPMQVDDLGSKFHFVQIEGIGPLTITNLYSNIHFDKDGRFGIAKVLSRFELGDQKYANYVVAASFNKSSAVKCHVYVLAENTQVSLTF